MNLADAIRKAATDGPPILPNVPASVPQPGLAENVPVTEPVVLAESITSIEPAVLPEPPNIALLGGNVVRIEMFMTAEQSTSMLRAIMTGQHTVLTLAEAAHYLRVRPQTIAKMAEDNELPCVEIDGKWRFLKHHLDEWLFSLIGQSDSEEENQDVA